VQRTRPAAVHRPRPRRRHGREAAGTDPAGGGVLRRRDRAGRGTELPPRLHGQPRLVRVTSTWGTPGPRAIGIPCAEGAALPAPEQSRSSPTAAEWFAGAGA